MSCTAAQRDVFDLTALGSWVKGELGRRYQAAVGEPVPPELLAALDMPAGDDGAVRAAVTQPGDPAIGTD